MEAPLKMVYHSANITVVGFLFNKSPSHGPPHPASDILALDILHPDIKEQHNSHPSQYSDLSIARLHTIC